jgi:hypothetical protein
VVTAGDVSKNPPTTRASVDVPLNRRLTISVLVRDSLSGIKRITFSVSQGGGRTGGDMGVVVGPGLVSPETADFPATAEGMLESTAVHVPGSTEEAVPKVRHCSALRYRRRVGREPRRRRTPFNLITRAP